MRVTAEGGRYGRAAVSGAAAFTRTLARCAYDWKRLAAISGAQVDSALSPLSPRSSSQWLACRLSRYRMAGRAGTWTQNLLVAARHGCALCAAGDAARDVPVTARSALQHPPWRLRTCDWQRAHGRRAHADVRRRRSTATSRRSNGANTSISAASPTIKRASISIRAPHIARTRHTEDDRSAAGTIRTVRGVARRAARERSAADVVGATQAHAAGGSQSCSASWAGHSPGFRLAVDSARDDLVDADVFNDAGLWRPARIRRR